MGTKCILCSFLFLANASLVFAGTGDSTAVKVKPAIRSVMPEQLNDSKFVFKPREVASRMPVLQSKDNCVPIPNMYKEQSPELAEKIMKTVPDRKPAGPVVSPMSMSLSEFIASRKDTLGKSDDLPRR